MNCNLVQLTPHPVLWPPVLSSDLPRCPLTSGAIISLPVLSSDLLCHPLTSHDVLWPPMPSSDLLHCPLTSCAALWPPVLSSDPCTVPIEYMILWACLTKPNSKEGNRGSYMFSLINMPCVFELCTHLHSFPKKPSRSKIIAFIYKLRDRFDWFES